jgi:hypothetical protein
VWVTAVAVEVSVSKKSKTTQAARLASRCLCKCTEKKLGTHLITTAHLPQQGVVHVGVSRG